MIKCPTCSRTDFESVKGMKSHHKMSHGVSIAGKTFICEECDQEFKGYDTWYGKRRFCSTSCYGKNKTKATEDLEDFYRSERWQNKKEEIRERDNHMCQECDNENNLHVHHIVPMADGGAKLDSDNLVTLCQDCHIEVHRELVEKAQ